MQFAGASPNPTPNPTPKSSERTKKRHGAFTHKDKCMGDLDGVESGGSSSSGEDAGDEGEGSAIDLEDIDAMGHEDVPGADYSGEDASRSQSQGGIESAVETPLYTPTAPDSDETPPLGPGTRTPDGSSRSHRSKSPGSGESSVFRPSEVSIDSSSSSSSGGAALSNSWPGKDGRAGGENVKWLSGPL